MACILVCTNHDGWSFGGPYQALPTRGYMHWFEDLLDSKYITVKVNTDYFQVKDKIKCG
jgi:UDP-galactopyranose mutase